MKKSARVASASSAKSVALHAENLAAAADPLTLHYLATHTVLQVYEEHIRTALVYAKGNVAQASRALDMTRRSVYLAARRFGIAVGRGIR